MKIFFKIKKNKFIIFLLLFFNQFLLNAHAINSKKIDLGKSGKYKLERKFYYQTNSLISKENKDQINQTKIEAKEIEAFSKEIDDFLEETFDKNDFEDFKNQKNKPPQANDNVNELDKKSTNKDNGKSSISHRYKNIKSRLF